MKGDMVGIMGSMGFFSECGADGGDDIPTIELPVGILEAMLSDIRTIGHCVMHIPIPEVRR
jgi:hypothetical protein